jgi:hypothetical protein
MKAVNIISTGYKKKVLVTPEINSDLFISLGG